MSSFITHFSMFFLVAFTSINVCWADCDNLQDTCPAAPPEKQTIFINGLPCKNPATIMAHDFKSTELSKAGSTDNVFRSSMHIVTAAEFAGLNTLGLSIGRTDIAVDGVVPLHYHPRATEIIFVTKGVLIAGFLDTKNQLFQKSLNQGDVFVFPKGLFHFHLNRDLEVATVLSVFNSQSPGLASVTTSTLDSTIESLDKLISLSDSQIQDATNFTLPGLDSIYS